jgi:hypothetical protein
MSVSFVTLAEGRSSTSFCTDRERNSWILDPEDRERGPFQESGGEDDEMGKSRIPAFAGVTRDGPIRLAFISNPSQQPRCPAPDTPRAQGSTQEVR